MLKFTVNAVGGHCVWTPLWPYSQVLGVARTAFLIPFSSGGSLGWSVRAVKNQLDCSRSVQAFLGGQVFLSVPGLNPKKNRQEWLFALRIRSDKPNLHIVISLQLFAGGNTFPARLWKSLLLPHPSLVLNEQLSVMAGASCFRSGSMRERGS